MSDECLEAAPPGAGPRFWRYQPHLAGGFHGFLAWKHWL